MTAAALAALLLAAGARAGEEAAECPQGTHRISTDNPYEPFRCVKDDAKAGGLGAASGPKGFELRPRCPRGTRPVASSSSLQPYRCVRAESEAPDPELAPLRGDDEAPAAAPAESEEDPLTRGCPKGKRKVRTNDPLRPFHCVVQATRVKTLDDGTFGRFAISRQISFEYPRAFRIQDAWKEEVPTLYLTLDSEGAGKPVTITITRSDSGQSTYQELDAAIARDVDWAGATDGGAVPVAGIRARVTFVPGDTRSVYLPVSKESYYALVYSAPADAYEAYLPAFNRLLKSLRLGAGAR